MNSQWSNNLRKKMEAHEAASPDGLWENIEQIILQESPLRTKGLPVQFPSGREKRLLWVKRIGAAAALFLLLLLVGDLLLKEPVLHSPAIVQSPEMEYKRENIHTPSIDHSNEGTLLAEGGLHKPLTLHNRPTTLTTLTSTAPIDRETDDPLSDREVEVIDSESELPTEVSEEIPVIEEKSGNSKGDFPIPHPIITRRSKPAKWQTSLYASNSTSGASKAYSGYRSFLSEGLFREKDEASPLLVKHPHEGIMTANRQSVVHTEARHRQPVTMGASIKYNLDEKWSLTSGVTYTLLSSQLRSGSDNYYYTSEQTLHNIGIPLDIHYSLWKGRNTTLYATGGGMVEKNISGRLSTDYVVNGKLESTDEEQISINRLQWSLNSSIGIEYNLFSKIGLYAEPGVIYYFKNGSGIETIYKEKPMNINFRVGLRFSLGD